MTDVIVQDKDVIIEVQQPTIPPAAPPPKIGLVEINQVVTRGTAWMTGSGPPTLPGGQFGDMYLDATTGDMYQWDGNAWQYVGTFAPSTLTAAEILAELITVDGAGSLLDADLLDGQHGAYYASKAALDANSARDDGQDTQIAANVTAINNNAAAIADNVTKDNAQDARMTTIEGVNATQTTNISANATAISTETTNRTNADTALQTNITAEQSARIAADATKEPAITAGNPAYFWAGDKTWKAVPAAGIPEAPTDGLIYGRKNSAWATVIGGATTDDAPPAGPLVDGQLWWKSSNGTFYIYYDDGNTQQWVQAAGSASMQVQKTARTRNRVNNPTAQVSQENGSTNVSTTASYPVDQWVMQFSGIVGNAQKITTLVSPEGTNSFVALYASTIKGSLAAGDFLIETLPIEGLDVADLAWGTAGAKAAVLRFCASCATTGTYAFSIANGAGDRTYLGSFTITAANTPQVFSFAIPGDTTGTWLKDTGIGMRIRFAPAAGSTYVGVAGWQAGTFFAPPGCTNGAAVTNPLYITDVGLYADPDATGLPPPFNAPTYTDDLIRCCRYWERTNMLLMSTANTGVCFFAVAKRISPSLSIVPQSGSGATVGMLTGATDYRTAYQNVANSGTFAGALTGNARLI